MVIQELVHLIGAINLHVAGLDHFRNGSRGIAEANVGSQKSSVVSFLGCRIARNLAGHRDIGAKKLVPLFRAMKTRLCQLRRIRKSCCASNTLQLLHEGRIVDSQKAELAIQLDPVDNLLAERVAH